MPRLRSFSFLRALSAPFRRRPPAPSASSPRSLKPDLGALLPLVPVFADPALHFGSWKGGEMRDGVMQMPFFAFSRQADALVEAAYRGNWVRPEIDWAAWGQGPVGVRLRAEPAAMASASVDEIAHVLTLLVRGDRFNEGLLASAFEDRLLHRLLARVEALAHVGR